MRKTSKEIYQGEQTSIKFWLFFEGIVSEYCDSAPSTTQTTTITTTKRYASYAKGKCSFSEYLL